MNYAVSRFPMDTKAKSRGFTLIELLVVIAIISLLVSILLPSLNRAKVLAMGVVCLNNLRNYGQANALYQAESEGWCVPHLDVTAPSGDDVWHSNERFRSYVSGPKRESTTFYQQWWPTEYLCPLATMAQEMSPPEESGIDAGDVGDIRYCYGYNRNKLSTNFYVEGYFLMEADILTPSRTMQFVDALNVYSWWYDSNKYAGENVKNGATVAYRHPRESANMSFFDGHAGRLDETKISRDFVTSDEPVWKIVR